MTTRSTQYMPLATAYLCLDCLSVCNSADHCPACASRALMGLAGVLNREQADEAKTGFALTACVHETAEAVSLAA